MNHALCIYLDKNIATKAAALVRRKGASAHVKVETLRKPGEGDERPVFILETEKSDSQKAIDSIANAAERQPEIAAEALHCPNCSSIRVAVPGHNEVSPSVRGFTRIVEKVSRALGIGSPTHLSCQDCGHQWAPQSRGNLSN
ncbi:MAG: hypothetical protein HKN23_02105 [Verrucomicrobiales bacterium]|nr:hypothetical protein [Verrucomicrobiales bacterium]